MQHEEQVPLRTIGDLVNRQSNVDLLAVELAQFCREQLSSKQDHLGGCIPKAAFT